MKMSEKARCEAEIPSVGTRGVKCSRCRFFTAKRRVKLLPREGICVRRNGLSIGKIKVVYCGNFEQKRNKSKTEKENKNEKNNDFKRA
jgi:hypothetical protein